MDKDFNEKVYRQSLISSLNMLDEHLGNERRPFEGWDRYKTTALEAIRDAKVDEYNKKIKKGEQ